jgi:hypothetical protein
MTVNMQDTSGSGGLFNTPLARPYYYDKIMERVYERDFLREITNSEIAERITSCAQTVQIMKAPEVAPWRTYQINQQMVNSSVSATAISLSICYAAYQSLKFDELVIHYACENWAQFEEKILEACYESFVAAQREWVFTSMIGEVSPHNRGNAAGKHANIPLGDVGAPRVITRATIIAELANMKLVLNEHLHWVEHNMFILVPPELNNVLVESNFANQAWVGGNEHSMAVEGAWSRGLMGFNIYETNHLQSTMDNGLLCYYILAGHRDAFAYASEIIRSRVVQGIDSWSTMYQMLAVWGGAMLYPNYLALGFWHFDPTA